MPRTNYQAAISDEAREALHILAHNIRQARRARRWSLREAAARAVVSVNAYRAAEAGELGTAMGVYLSILDTLDLVDSLADVAAPHRDELGRRLRGLPSGGGS